MPARIAPSEFGTATRAKNTRESPCRIPLGLTTITSPRKIRVGKLLSLTEACVASAQQAGIGVVDGDVHDCPRGINDFGKAVAILQAPSHHVFDVGRRHEAIDR